jgi:hypothetical protein
MGKTMIEMKLSPDPANANLNILELKIKAPKAPEQTSIPAVKIPTLIYIDDSIQEAQLPTITHALTDTVNRITWAEQIQLASTKHRLADHLEILEIQKNEIFKVAESKGTCNLILLTNNETKELRRQISKASEFLTDAHVVQPTTTIELIDNLNDHIKHLKPKTLVNLEIQIELEAPEDTLQPLDYIARLNKDGPRYFANLIDLASEEEKAYAFITSSRSCSATNAFDDLVISRSAQGGQRLTL